MKFYIKKLNKISLVFFCIICASLILSLTMFLVKKNGARRVFVFPSVEKGVYIVETRRLQTKTSKSNVEYYIDELMLGPQTERCRFIFPKKTKILSIIQKNKVLYVDFSKDIVNPEEESKLLPGKQAMELFKTNIKKNFPRISRIEIFVEGNPAYENR